ncbi:MAG: hypothetical protein QXJ75_03210 [Candidatus Bathyarchaeia archaeon]
MEYYQNTIEASRLGYFGLESTADASMTSICFDFHVAIILGKLSQL